MPDDIRTVGERPRLDAEVAITVGVVARPDHARPQRAPKPSCPGGVGSGVGRPVQVEQSPSPGPAESPAKTTSAKSDGGAGTEKGARPAPTVSAVTT